MWDKTDSISFSQHPGGDSVLLEYAGRYENYRLSEIVFRFKIKNLKDCLIYTLQIIFHLITEMELKHSEVIQQTQYYLWKSWRLACFHLTKEFTDIQEWSGFPNQNPSEIFKKFPSFPFNLRSLTIWIAVFMIGQPLISFFHDFYGSNFKLRQKLFRLNSRPTVLCLMIMCIRFHANKLLLMMIRFSQSLCGELIDQHSIMSVLVKHTKPLTWFYTENLVILQKQRNVNKKQFKII